MQRLNLETKDETNYVKLEDHLETFHKLQETYLDYAENKIPSRKAYIEKQTPHIIAAIKKHYHVCNILAALQDPTTGNRDQERCLETVLDRLLDVEKGAPATGFKDIGRMRQDLRRINKDRDNQIAIRESLKILQATEGKVSTQGFLSTPAQIKPLSDPAKSTSELKMDRKL